MTSFAPYTYIQCPCTGTTLPSHDLHSGKDEGEAAEDDEEDDRTFDPRAPRANYSLYPLEHLLYCEDCHQIRCPRCVLDEISTWYCPNCLFEVPSSSVKSEGNRCTRSCFQCPTCTAPLSVSSTEANPEGLGAEYASAAGPYVLNCGFCHWSSKEIGIQLEKPNSVFAQLSKIKNGGGTYITPKERRREQRRDISDISEDTQENEITLDPQEVLDAESQFSNLKTFYHSQLSDSSPSGAMGYTGDYGYGSPGTLSRIMGIYTGGTFADKKSKSKNAIMREASSALEGLQISHPSNEALTKLSAEGWEGTTMSSQRNAQSHNPRFLSDMRPLATLLRTKRSKRCRTCRHILSKPESKVQNTRFRLRLVALNYIPSISIKPLAPAPSPFLASSLPVQFLLTFKNPLFEKIKVNIATPANTPGRFASKVTVLCPQFEVGANTDVWDEALGVSSSSQQKRRAKDEQHQAEAGKVWERGRNWVSVVVEVVPASLRLDGAGSSLGDGEKEDNGPLREDEDIVEIPVFVRVEWEAEAAAEEGSLGKGELGREKKELAYWCVLGVGRIADE